jgi:NADH:ubiquinone oxidoreductase subunit 6 (subunit J)
VNELDAIKKVAWANGANTMLACVSAIDFIATRNPMYAGLALIAAIAALIGRWLLKPAA